MPGCQRACTAVSPRVELVGSLSPCARRLLHGLGIRRLEPARLLLSDVVRAVPFDRFYSWFAHLIAVSAHSSSCFRAPVDRRVYHLTAQGMPRAPAPALSLKRRRLSAPPPTLLPRARTSRWRSAPERVDTELSSIPTAACELHLAAEVRFVDVVRIGLSIAVMLAAWQAIATCVRAKRISSPASVRFHAHIGRVVFRAETRRTNGATPADVVSVGDALCGLVSGISATLPGSMPCQRSQ